MRWTGLFVFPLLWLLVAGCSDDLGYMEPTPTPTRIAEKPQVISASPDIVVESWEYLSPQSERAPDAFPANDPDALEFAPGNRQAYIVWREGGFDLVWGGFFCSIQPILTIGKGKIELWENNAIWLDCEAVETIHAFKVELETDIPLEAWSYAIHEGAPTDTTSEQGRTVTGQIVVAYGDHRPVARAPAAIRTWRRVRGRNGCQRPVHADQHSLCRDDRSCQPTAICDPRRRGSASRPGYPRIPARPPAGAAPERVPSRRHALLRRRL